MFAKITQHADSGSFIMQELRELCKLVKKILFIFVLSPRMVVVKEEHLGNDKAATIYLRNHVLLTVINRRSVFIIILQ